MFNVVIHPGGYPGPDGRIRPFPYRQPSLIETIDQARASIREVFPHAVFSSRWEVLGTRPPRFSSNCGPWIPPIVTLPEGCSYWWQASIRVFPCSHWMELDENGTGECGLIYNETNEPPEPGARLFYGIRQLLDV